MLATGNFRSDPFNFTNMNLGLIAYWLAVFLYQRNPDRNRKLWNIVSPERYIFHMQMLSQKGQNNKIKNIVSVCYGIQCSLNNFELSAYIMTNSSPYNFRLHNGQTRSHTGP
jgi:hypothetical protein